MIIEKIFEYKITENDGKKTIAITKYLGNEEDDVYTSDLVWE